MAAGYHAAGEGAMGWEGMDGEKREGGEGEMRLAPRILVQNVCNYMKLLD